MNKKPIIRHCANCKYSFDVDYNDRDCFCEVRYERIECMRIRALLCGFYREEDE